MLGFILACVPGALIAGWILLPVGFILGIISLFLHNKKLWPGLVAIVLSVIGTIVGIVVFIAVLGNAVNDAVNDSNNSSSDSSSSSSSDSGQSGDTTKFGEEHKFDDGTTVTVDKPAEFQPSDTAATGSSSASGTAEKFKVTVHNGSKKPIDAIGISTTAQSGGSEAESIFDSEAGIDTPDGKIQPGKDLTYEIAYMVQDPNDISLDLSIVGDNAEMSEATFVS